MSAKDSSGYVKISLEPADVAPLYIFPEGTNTVTYTATDSSKNTAVCRVVVTVHGNQ